MPVVHEEVLAAAQAAAAADWTFALAAVVRQLPHLNPGTVRTHVASRCCVNAPAHHQSRHGYFRALGGGRYRLEPLYRRRPRRTRRSSSFDAVLAAVEPGVDATLVADALRLTPTERLETMARAARSLAAMRRS